ncbi:MAG: hypothetical protein QGH15_03535 [Kiritimatiellia bacterium]|jgi:hypothetical protein|nr:hypothetical protein [Kiritimatiellia bacterium]
MKTMMLAVTLMMAAGVLGSMTGCMTMKGSCGCGGGKLDFENADFYDKEGNFDVEKGKDAIISLMKYHGYPVYPNMREELWVSDYGTGKFTEVGLAARMWANNTKDKYMLMDLFLLPNQMLPEHWHLDGEGDDEGIPAKLEGWLIRYGSSHVVGEGEDNLKVKVPQSHDGGKVTVRHEVFCKAGDWAQLSKVYTHHWQLAGPEGAIITEVANCHCNGSVRHQDKAINDNFLGK